MGLHGNEYKLLVHRSRYLGSHELEVQTSSHRLDMYNNFEQPSMPSSRTARVE